MTREEEVLVDLRVHLVKAETSCPPPPSINRVRAKIKPTKVAMHHVYTAKADGRLLGTQELHLNGNNWKRLPSEGLVSQNPLVGFQERHRGPGTAKSGRENSR
jgi:hypothetical protein